MAVKGFQMNAEPTNSNSSHILVSLYVLLPPSHSFHSWICNYILIKVTLKECIILDEPAVQQTPIANRRKDKAADVQKHIRSDI